MPGVPRYPLLAPWYRLVATPAGSCSSTDDRWSSCRAARWRPFSPRCSRSSTARTASTRSSAELGGAAARSSRPSSCSPSGGVLVEGPRGGSRRRSGHGHRGRVRDRAGGRRAAASGRAGGRRRRIGGRRCDRADAARIRGRRGGRRSAGHAGSAVDLAVVAPCPSEAPQLLEWNLAALARGTSAGSLSGRSTALVSLSGRSSCPARRRATSACFSGSRGTSTTAPTCAASRASRRPLGRPAPLESLAAAVAAQIVLCWLGGADLALAGLLHVLETRPLLALGTHRCFAFPAARRAPPSPVSPRRFRGTRPSRLEAAHDRDACRHASGAPSRRTSGIVRGVEECLAATSEPRFFQAACEVGTEAGPARRRARPPERDRRRRPDAGRGGGRGGGRGRRAVLGHLCPARAARRGARARSAGTPSSPRGSPSSRTRQLAAPGFRFRRFTDDTVIAWVEGPRASRRGSRPIFPPSSSSSARPASPASGRSRTRRAAGSPAARASTTRCSADCARCSSATRS